MGEGIGTVWGKGFRGSSYYNESLGIAPTE